MFCKILRFMALFRLDPQQKAVMEELAEKQKSLLEILAESHSEDEDYLQANMMNVAFGTEVLKRQVENKKQEEGKVSKLIEDCRKAGISEWRIKLIT